MFGSKGPEALLITQVSQQCAALSVAGTAQVKIRSLFLTPTERLKPFYGGSIPTLLKDPIRARS